MSNERDIEIAANGLKKLEKMHNEFLLELKKNLGKEENPVGSLKIDDGVISITSLGVSLEVKHRPVVVDGKPKLVEYVVIAEHEGERGIVLQFYLQPNYILTKSVNTDSKLCDYNNSYIEKILVYEAAGQLLKSPIFRPHE